MPFNITITLLPNPSMFSKKSCSHLGRSLATSTVVTDGPALTAHCPKVLHRQYCTGVTGHDSALIPPSSILHSLYSYAPFLMWFSRPLNFPDQNSVRIPRLPHSGDMFNLQTPLRCNTEPRGWVGSSPVSYSGCPQIRSVWRLALLRCSLVPTCKWPNKPIN
jgi:hypothetical protein